MRKTSAKLWPTVVKRGYWFLPKL